MKSGLVVIDMLKDFQDGVLANSAAEEIVEPLKKLVEAARASDDWVVIYGNDAHKPGDLEYEVFGVHAEVGTEGADVIPEIAPQEGDEIVNKRYYSTFTETDLDSICKVHGIKRLVMVGQHTDCCVRHTTYDAYVRGLEVGVVSDATCVFAPLSNQPVEERQEAALGYLQGFYNSKVMSSEELLSEMLS